MFKNRSGSALGGSCSDTLCSNEKKRSGARLKLLAGFLALATWCSTLNGQAPNLVSLAPNSAPVGSPSLTITINGTGFTPSSTASWLVGFGNGFGLSKLPTTFVSPTQLTAMVSSDLLSQLPVQGIFVLVGQSNSLNFNLLSQVVNSLSPMTSPVQASPLTLTVNGSNFLPGSMVQFGNTLIQTTFVSSTRLTAIVPPALLASSGTVIVRVGTSNEVAFIVGSPSLQCTAAAGASAGSGIPPPIANLRFEGLTELFPDILISCQGPANQVVTSDIIVSSSINLTSRIVAPGAPAGTEALLLVGDPPPSQQILNTNVFQGVVNGNSGESAITFPGVPISVGSTLRIVNLRGDAHQLGPFSRTTPQTVTVFLLMGGNVTITNPQFMAAIVKPTQFHGLNVSSVNDQRTLRAEFIEGFPSAFKTQVAPGGVQDVPGVVYNTESGFFNPALVPVFERHQSGLADSGTRLMLQFLNVPSGVNVYASVLADNGTNTSNAQLVSTNITNFNFDPTNFISGSSMFDGAYAPVTINNGSGAAVWEVTADDPNVTETLQFHVVLTGMTQPGLGSITVLGSLAPLSDVNFESSDVSIPGFAADSATNFIDMTLLSNSSSSSSVGEVSVPSVYPLEYSRTVLTNPPQVQVGSNLSFNYGLLNNGPGPAMQVTVNSNLPSALQYLGCSTSPSAPGSCPISNNGACTGAPNGDGSTTVTGSFPGPLPAGQAPSFTVCAQPTSEANGSTVNVTTVVSSNLADSFPDDNTMTTSFQVTTTPPPPVPVTFATNPPGLLVQAGASAAQVNPSIMVAQGSTFSFSVPSPQAVPLTSNTAKAQGAQSNVQYAFTSWNDGSNSPIRTGIYPPVGGGTFTASFDTQYLVTATATTGGTVVLTPNAVNNYYTTNSTVQITATPQPGYAFNGFTGDVTQSVNPLIIVISGSVNIVANFVKISPTVSSFTANPSFITSGQSTTLAWTVSGSNVSITIDNGVGNVSNVTSEPVEPTQTTLYTLTASNNAGSTSAKVTVTVEPSGTTDLALNKVATQSSTYAPGFTDASKALDGNIDGVYADGSLTHTGLDSNAWWEVDLGASATISSIVVWNRTDCCGSRLSDYWVFVSNTPFLATDSPTTLQNRAGTWSSHQTMQPNPSAAITVPGAPGRYVRVQLSGTNYLALAEVQVFGTLAVTTAQDLAVNQAATQSSTYAPGFTDASKAVDGNTDGKYADGSLTHTGLDSNAWWGVDLGASATVSSIVVWNRTDCCGSRLSDYWVFVSNTPFASTDTPTTLQNRAGTWSSHQTMQPNPSATITVPGAQGRYVRVQLSGTNYLALAEVQVFGTLTITAAQDLAQNQAATQSSTYAPGFTDASKAVDGNTDGKYTDGSLTHTGLDSNAWWEVDLGASAIVSSIVVWNRTDCCGNRLSDYWVFVSNTPFESTDTPTTLQNRAGTWSSHQTTQPNPSATITVPGAQGRYVRVQLSGANYLALAEVQIFGQ